MITNHDIREVSEQIQNDLLCLLDGQADKLLTDACQIIVDRFKSIKDKLDNLGVSE